LKFKRKCHQVAKHSCQKKRKEEVYYFTNSIKKKIFKDFYTLAFFLKEKPVSGEVFTKFWETHFSFGAVFFPVLIVFHKLFVNAIKSCLG